MPKRGALTTGATLAIAVGLAACGGAAPADQSPAPLPAATGAMTEPAETGPPQWAPATAPGPKTEAPTDLPAAVATVRDAVAAAAHARDYRALGALLDPRTFSYSFGESGDPVGYWRALEEEGEVPVLGDYLPVVLSWPWAEQAGIYVWPAIQAKDPAEWTEADLGPVRLLYSEEQLDAFRDAGGYAGWRVGIRADGAWLYYVEGD